MKMWVSADAPLPVEPLLWSLFLSPVCAAERWKLIPDQPLFTEGQVHWMVCKAQQGERNRKRNIDKIKAWFGCVQ